MQKSDKYWICLVVVWSLLVGCGATRRQKHRYRLHASVSADSLQVQVRDSTSFGWTRSQEGRTTLRLQQIVYSAPDSQDRQYVRSVLTGVVQQGETIRMALCGQNSSDSISTRVESQQHAAVSRTDERQRRGVPVWCWMWIFLWLLWLAYAASKRRR